MQCRVRNQARMMPFAGIGFQLSNVRLEVAPGWTKVKPPGQSASVAVYVPREPRPGYPTIITGTGLSTAALSATDPMSAWCAAPLPRVPSATRSTAVVRASSTS